MIIRMITYVKSLGITDNIEHYQIVNEFKKCGTLNNKNEIVVLCEGGFNYRADTNLRQYIQTVLLSTENYNKFHDSYNVYIMSDISKVNIREIHIRKAAQRPQSKKI